ncbi:MAG: thioredoxin domain-containing protein [Candidatus Saccharibacteria bacterium]
MSKRTWIIFAIIVIGLLTGMVVSSRNGRTQIDVSSVDANTVQQASKANGNIADHVFGKSDSKVVLIEYGDFQCPACGKSFPGINTITEEYKATITYIFRNFPLPASTHPNALAAAATVESAGLQGKYWEMYDLVYENQQQWSNLTGAARTDMFISYANRLGLNETKFKTDLSDPAITQKIAFDRAIGDKLGINSTPTFFLNGVKLDSDTVSDVQNSNGDKLRALIDSDLKKAGITPPSIVK